MAETSEMQATPAAASRPLTQLEIFFIKLSGITTAAIIFMVCSALALQSLIVSKIEEMPFLKGGRAFWKSSNRRSIPSPTKTIFRPKRKPGSSPRSRRYPTVTVPISRPPEGRLRPTRARPPRKPLALREGKIRFQRRVDCRTCFFWITRYAMSESAPCLPALPRSADVCRGSCPPAARWCRRNRTPRFRSWAWAGGPGENA